MLTVAQEARLAATKVRIAYPHWSVVHPGGGEIPGLTLAQCNEWVLNYPKEGYVVRRSPYWAENRSERPFNPTLPRAS